MRKSREPAHKYGAALYGAVWLPGGHAFMAGGGGHGLEDKIVVVRCADGKLSEEIGKLSLGKGHTPYRMLAHPSGRTFVFADQPKGNLHRVDVAQQPDSGPPQLTLDADDFAERASGLAGINCLNFSRDGRLLALGGEDGSITLLDWPSLTQRRKWSASKSEIRTLEVSAPHSNGAVLSIDQSGVCIVWDARSGEQIMQLLQPADMPRSKPLWGRFVAEPDGDISLFLITVWRQEGWLQQWMQDDAGDIQYVRRRRLADAPCPIADVSLLGGLVGCGTSEGDIVVVSTRTFKPVKYLKGAHMVYATAVTFAPDGSGLLSVSSDASAVVVPLRRVLASSGSSSRGSGGGGQGGAGALGVLMVVLAVVMALVAVLLGVYIRLYPTDLPPWIPPELVSLITGQPIYISVG